MKELIPAEVIEKKIYLIRGRFPVSGVWTHQY